LREGECLHAHANAKQQRNPNSQSRWPNSAPGPRRHKPSTNSGRKFLSTNTFCQTLFQQFRRPPKALQFLPKISLDCAAIFTYYYSQVKLHLQWAALLLLFSFWGGGHPGTNRSCHPHLK
jgi:hypothetical protein